MTNIKQRQNLAYLNTLDPRLREAIIKIAQEKDVEVSTVIAVYKFSYKAVKQFMRDADDHAWPIIMMPGLGMFKPNLTLTYRKKQKYYETPLKLRYKFKLLGSEPSTYHPQGIPDHLWE